MTDPKTVFDILELNIIPPAQERKELAELFENFNGWDLWIKKGRKKKCSECGYETAKQNNFRYCPMCGAFQSSIK